MKFIHPSPRFLEGSERTERKSYLVDCSAAERWSSRRSTSDWSWQRTGHGKNMLSLTSRLHRMRCPMPDLHAFCECASCRCPPVLYDGLALVKGHLLCAVGGNVCFLPDQDDHGIANRAIVLP